MWRVPRRRVAAQVPQGLFPPTFLLFAGGRALKKEKGWTGDIKKKKKKANPPAGSRASVPGGLPCGVGVGGAGEKLGVVCSQRGTWTDRGLQVPSHKAAGLWRLSGSWCTPLP